MANAVNWKSMKKRAIIGAGVLLTVAPIWTGSMIGKTASTVKQAGCGGVKFTPPQGVKVKLPDQLANTKGK